MARIERLDEAALNFLLTSEPFLRVRDFLVRIGLPLDSVSHSGLCQSGLSGFDQVVTTQEGFFQSAELRERMKCLLIGQEPRILEMAAKERETLFAYFKDIRFSAGDSAIVDLGWQASSILSLQNLLRLQEPGCRLTGFYFGTWTTAAPVVDAGGQLESFFTHLGEPRYRAGLLAECVGLLELLFSAPHPTVTGLERVNGQWSPLCGDWETTAGQRECLEMVSQSAMAFVADMLAVEKKLTAHEAPFGYLESVLERILRHPTYDESSILGALPHRDSFGGKAPWRHLAKVPTLPQTVFKPSSLREAYARAYWKQGFVVQLGPTERRMIGV